MKKLSTLIISLLFLNILNSYGQQFGQLQFKVPADWSQQSREEWISFTGKEPETGLFIEMRVFKTNAYALKPDSAFRLEWANRQEIEFNNKTVLPIRKRYNQDSHLYFEGGSEAIEGSPKRYRHLYGFVVATGIQTIELVTGSLADYKKLRYYLSDFLDGVKVKTAAK